MAEGTLDQDNMPSSSGKKGREKLQDLVEKIGNDATAMRHINELKEAINDHNLPYRDSTITNYDFPNEGFPFHRGEKTGFRDKLENLKYYSGQGVLDGSAKSERNAYKGTLKSFKEHVEESETRLGKIKEIEKGREDIDKVASRAYRDLEDEWRGDAEIREYRYLLTAHKKHGVDPVAEVRTSLREEGRNGYTPGEGKKHARSMPKFWGWLLIYLVLETIGNGYFYAKVHDGLIEGWGIAFIVSFCVIASGIGCGFFSSFLKGLVVAEGTSDSEHWRYKSSWKWVAGGLMVLVFVAAVAYFHKHAEELDLREKIVAFGLLFAFLGLIYWLIFGGEKSSTLGNSNLMYYYVPRPVHERLGWGLFACACCVFGIAIIMTAYFYREELLSLQGVLNEDGVSETIMKGVWARFKTFDFLPSGWESIGLLVINIIIFGKSMHDGYGMNGPFQNYKKSREEFEKRAEFYDTQVNDIDKLKRDGKKHRQYIKDNIDPLSKNIQYLFEKYGTFSIGGEPLNGLAKERWDQAEEIYKRFFGDLDDSDQEQSK